MKHLGIQLQNLIASKKYDISISEGDGSINMKGWDGVATGSSQDILIGGNGIQKIFLEQIPTEWTDNFSNLNNWDLYQNLPTIIDDAVVFQGITSDKGSKMLSTFILPSDFEANFTIKDVIISQQSDFSMYISAENSGSTQNRWAVTIQLKNTGLVDIYSWSFVRGTTNKIFTDLPLSSISGIMNITCIGASMSMSIDGLAVSVETNGKVAASEKVKIGIRTYGQTDGQTDLISFDKLVIPTGEVE